MNKRIWLSLAHMGGREQDFIKEAFDTNWVVPLGPNVDAFEESLRQFLVDNGQLTIDSDRRVVAPKCRYGRTPFRLDSSWCKTGR